MEHIAVESTMLASLAHDQASNTLQALFKKGGLYEYSDVSVEEFTEVLQPSHAHKLSVGSAFRAIIQSRKVGRKVDGKAQATPVSAVQENRAPDAPRADSPSLGAEIPPQLPAEAQAVSRKSTELTVQAEDIQVVDPASQTAASDLLLAIAQIRSEIATTFKPMKDAAYKAHKTICDQERMLDDPLLLAEKTLKSRIGAFVADQERIASEREQELRRDAEEKAVAEAAQRTQELAIDQAIDLESRGQTAAAEAVLANPAPVAPRYVAPAPVAPAVARTQGVSTRTGWDFRILDITKIPREYLMVNEVAIRNLGKNTQGKAQVPGVEFYPTTIVAASRGGRR